MSEIEMWQERGVAGWVHVYSPFGLFMTDTQLNIREWNQWLEKYSGKGAPEVIGSNLFELYPELFSRKMNQYFHEALEGRNVILSHVFHHHLIPIELDDTGNEPDNNMPQSAIVSPLIIDDQILGTIGYIEDVSERIRREKELQNTIDELQQTLNQVKILRGMLPICANCKKIRDDKGYWNQIEAYITEHSEAVFSHGICPECMAKLYPEFMDDYDEATAKDRHKEKDGGL